ncbi:MAG: acyl-CoA synthetase [Rhodoferax sp.]|nr:acyl-CoA synthetase [Rhodoferax sp.]
MADFWPVATLATQAPNASRVVARRANGNQVSHADLLARSACWYASFMSQAASEWSLFLNDPFEFAAALLGAWHAGKTVVLPGDDLPGTVKNLQQAGCALAGDLPGGLQPAVETVGHAPVFQPLDPRQTRLKVFTSGSQGLPQAIDKGLHQLLAEVTTLEATFGPRLAGVQTPTIWTTVSHQHIYGLLFYILWPLSSGRPFAMQRLLYPEDMAAQLGPAPSVLVATPAHLKRLGNQLDWGMARTGVRAVFSSGGALPFEASRSAAQAMGCIPMEVFGSSETGGIAWRQAASANQSWQPFVGVQWREESGCLAVQSPNLPDDDWWVTTDRVQAGNDGSFQLLGRSDRIVKIEEKRVSLDAIERTLLATALVKEVRAVLVRTAVGERIGVVAVPSDSGRQLVDQGRKVLGDKLKHAVTGVVEPVALPRRWRFVEALPFNAQGKTPEALLAELFAPPDSSAMPPVQWLSRTATDARVTLRLEADLPLFAGHFDAAPILPGVAQLDWAIELAKQCFSVPPQFVRLEALKFMRPAMPGMELILDVSFKAQHAKEAVCSITFAWSSLGKESAEPIYHSSGRVLWSLETPETVHA